eukprot:7833795-Pyramimonas_sp.AAC.1
MVDSTNGRFYQWSILQRHFRALPVESMWRQVPQSPTLRRKMTSTADRRTRRAPAAGGAFGGVSGPLHSAIANCAGQPQCPVQSGPVRSSQ